MSRRRDSSEILAAINQMIAGTRKARVYEDGGVSPDYVDSYVALNGEYTPVAYVPAGGDNVLTVYGSAPTAQTPRRDAKGRFYVLADYACLGVTANPLIISYLEACSVEIPDSELLLTSALERYQQATIV